MFQKLALFSNQVIGCLVTTGLAVFLILAWVLTEPLFQLSEWIAGSDKLKMKN
jgi:hypothetical protein